MIRMKSLCHLFICTNIPYACYVCSLCICFVGFSCAQVSCETWKQLNIYCWTNLVCLKGATSDICVCLMLFLCGTIESLILYHMNHLRFPPSIPWLWTSFYFIIILIITSRRKPLYSINLPRSYPPYFSFFYIYIDSVNPQQWKNFHLEMEIDILCISVQMLGSSNLIEFVEFDLDLHQIGGTLNCNVVSWSYYFYFMFMCRR